MEIFKEIEPIRAFLKTKKEQKKSVGLVPTMGALHDGHLSLIRASKAQNDLTVCSIYINPTQFNNPTDLAKYPKTVEKDIAMLQQGGCDVLFLPDNSTMYKKEGGLKLDFGVLDKVLEGEFRPGHFSGVALVVSKFFNIIQPDRAYFGQKDFQQFKVINRLVEELKFNIELPFIPTMREADGLAMSSRNLRLNPEERVKALIFFKSLQLGKEELLKGTSLSVVKNKVKSLFETTSGVRLEYFEIANAENLTVLENVGSSVNCIMLIAGFVGEIRLIDNMFVKDVK
jgi:pantoate--beta-alanine ligase